MKYKMIVLLLFLVATAFPQSLVLISPNGGETFGAEQMVRVQWQVDTTLFKYYTPSEIGIRYSIDSGKSWRDAWYEADHSSSMSHLWRVPHLKHGTDRALIRVSCRNIDESPSAVSNGTFTILASPNDAYEPNDDFASAKVISVGDSVVRNAIVMKSYARNDSTGIDTALTDVDFFKVSLTAGKVATISAVDQNYWDENDYEDMLMGPVFIRLFDASKNQVGMNFVSLSCHISQSGVYYCEISSMEGSDYWNRYGLSIRQTDPIAVISPNGGESFQTGQKVTIRWTADSLLGPFSFYYSIDNGSSWKLYSTPNAGSNSYPWTVPALKTRTDRASVKVESFEATADPRLFDVSNGTFTIQAAPSDAYEPNDAMSSAYAIALGDSVVKNASTCFYEDLYGDTTGVNGPSADPDYFKVNLTAGSLVRIRDWASDSEGLGRIPEMDLFDASQRLIPIFGSISYDSRCYNINQTGIYYIKVWPAFGDWEKYGLSIKSIATLLTQTSMLDTNAMQFDSNYHVYRSQLIADTTKLNIDFMLYKKYQLPITTMVLAPKDCAPLPDEKAKVKAILIIFDLSQYQQMGADIAIPYKPSDLNGYPDKALAVACQDYRTSDLWDSASSSIDTVKHQIVVHMAYLRFHFFQVYVKSDTTLASGFLKVSPAFGIKTNFLSQKQSIVAHLSLPKAVNADLRLYNVQGKCVRKSIFAAGAGSSTLLWNLGGLGSGKYFLTTKAGNYQTKEAILIMN